MTFAKTFALLLDAITLYIIHEKNIRHGIKKGIFPQRTRMKLRPDLTKRSKSNINLMCHFPMTCTIEVLFGSGQEIITEDGCDILTPQEGRTSPQRIGSLGFLIFPGQIAPLRPGCRCI